MSKKITIEQALELAAEHARQGNDGTARKLYEQVLRAQPDNPTARQALGRAPATGRSDGFSSDMRHLLGLYNSGRLEEAGAESERLAQLYPTQPMPANLKGAILLAQGRAEEAIVFIESAIELAPDYAEAWNNLGNAQFEAEREAAAVESFTRALELNQSPALVASANLGLGKALASLDQPAAARAALEQALARRPEDAATRIALGLALRQLGEVEASAEQLQKAVECDPRSSLAYFELGQSLRQLERLEDALASLKRSIELSPDNAKAHFHQGKLYAKLGDREQAAQSYRRSLDLDPDAAEVQHRLDALEGKRTAIAPREFVETEFDNFSADFDRILLESLEYRAPVVLLEMLEDAGQHEFSAVIDLGCGTGLMGEQLRARAGYQLGVDLSAKMLEQAREKKVYDELLQGDILEALSDATRNFDLVVAADVLVYIGDLLPLMTTFAEKTTPGALLGISTELHSVADEYALLHSGRYAHGKDYVCSVAAAAGLELRSFQAGDLRKEGGEWLPGGYYLFARGA